MSENPMLPYLGKLVEVRDLACYEALLHAPAAHEVHP